METPLTYAKHHKYIVGALAILVILATAVFARLGGKQTASTGNQLATVTLAEAKTYMKDRGTITANGTVESLEQAELRSQASGPVTRISAQIGQKVRRGQVLVSLQNADSLAQLAQAQATVKAQTARLEEMKRGLRTEELALAESQLNAAKQALEDTTSQQNLLVKNAMSALYNTGLSATPQPGTGYQAPTISGTYASEEKGSYTLTIYATGDGLKFQYNGLESGTGNVQTTPVPLGKRGLFVQFASQSVPVNSSWTIEIPNTQSSSFTTLSNAYNSAVEGRQAAINGAKSAYEAAQKGYDLKLAGASNEQIKAQAAAVEQAQASVAALAAQVDKTIIKSPIDGTVASLSVKYGELVSPGQLVASVVNKGGLQVKAYISDYDLPYIEEGAEVVITETAKGKVSRISPSINPQTKNVEIQVVVEDPDHSGLVVGQTANIKIAAKQSAGSNGPVFLLPLQAVKISSGSASVFTVKEDGTLEEKTVTLGAVAGEFVEVKEGLTPEMKLVTTVYELKAGQKVNME